MFTYIYTSTLHSWKATKKGITIITVAKQRHVQFLDSCFLRPNYENPTIAASPCHYPITFIHICLIGITTHDHFIVMRGVTESKEDWSGPG